MSTYVYILYKDIHALGRKKVPKLPRHHHVVMIRRAPSSWGRLPGKARQNVQHLMAREYPP